MESESVKAIMVVGLPGSGKTHYARTLAADTPALVMFDDIKDLSKLKLVLNTGCNVVITDPHLCFKANRAEASKWMEKNGVSEVEWVFFENNPDACKANVSKRNDGRDVERFLNTLWKYYDIPEGADVRKVWQ